MKIRITYSDGQYGYRRDEDWAGHPVVEVPDETVALWDAISAAANTLNDQLGALDNAWHSKPENCRGHARGTDGDCLWCGTPMAEVTVEAAPVADMPIALAPRDDVESVYKVLKRRVL